LDDNGRILHIIADLCAKNECPALFCGDLFDDPKSLTNHLLKRTFEWLNYFKRKRVSIYAIHGNHDQSERNSLENKSPNYISAFSEAYSNLIDVSFTTVCHKNVYVSGIPYLTDNKDFVESVKQAGARVKTGKHILLTHADLPGAKEPNGRELSHQNLPTDIYKLFDKFSLVLNGHIHKPQQIYSKVITLGATHHQRASDSGCDMGYWLIYENLSTEFVPLEMPQFKYIKEGDEPTDKKHFYIEVPKEVESKTTGITLSSSTSPKKIVKSYMKATGIKSKKKKTLLLKYLTNARD
jgi:DNA repair exonuclease SbcCD nuclease subunit